MKVTALKEKNLDFYSSNQDWRGRKIIDNKEIVDYQSNTTLRIWFNEQDSSFIPHWHNSLEIITPLENYYDATVGTQTFHLIPGEILVIPPCEMHSLSAPPHLHSGKRLIFLFDLSNIARFKGFSSIQPLMTKPIFINKATQPYIYEDNYRLLMQMSAEYFGNNELRELVIYSLLINFFVNIGRDHLNTSVLFPNVGISKQEEYIKRFNDVLEYIDNHYMNELSLEDIAYAAHFSKFHFARLFKQYTKLTFHDYLNCKRIKAAKRLLNQPDLTITDIAFQSGFSSISSFNRLFKQRENCTPREFRAIYSSSRLSG